MTTNPYQFTHTHLTHSFHKEPNSRHWYPSAGAMDQTRVILDMLWGRGQAVFSAPPEVRVVAIGVKGDLRATFIGMPAPTKAGESYFVAMVRPTADNPKGGYFVWDRSVESGKANMAEYRATQGIGVGKYARINCGNHDDISLEGFAAEIARAFDADDLPLTKAPKLAGGSQQAPIKFGEAAKRLEAAQGGTGQKKRGNKKIWKALAVLVVLGLLFLPGTLLFFEFFIDHDAPGELLGEVKLKEGKDFSLTIEPPDFGSGQDTIWAVIEKGTTSKGRFILKGELRCKRGKKKLKKKTLRINAIDKADTHLDKGKLKGQYRLGTWTSKATDAPLKCKGNLKASPGAFKRASLQNTRRQKPSDFLN